MEIKESKLFKKSNEYTLELIQLYFYLAMSEALELKTYEGAFEKKKKRYQTNIISRKF